MNMKTKQFFSTIILVLMNDDAGDSGIFVGREKTSRFLVLE
jgi:hypothetical protein